MQGMQSARDNLTSDTSVANKQLSIRPNTARSNYTGRYDSWCKCDTNAWKALQYAEPCRLCLGVGKHSPECFRSNGRRCKICGKFQLIPTVFRPCTGKSFRRLPQAKSTRNSQNSDLPHEFEKEVSNEVNRGTTFDDRNEPRHFNNHKDHARNDSNIARKIATVDDDGVISEIDGVTCKSEPKDTSKETKTPTVAPHTTCGQTRSFEEWNTAANSSAITDKLRNLMLPSKANVINSSRSSLNSRSLSQLTPTSPSAPSSSQYRDAHLRCISAKRASELAKSNNQYFFNLRVSSPRFSYFTYLQRYSRGREIFVHAKPPRNRQMEIALYGTPPTPMQLTYGSRRPEQYM